MKRKPESAPTSYSIGPFRLDPAAHALMRADVPELLGPRAVAVLAAIVARAPEPVLKDTIIGEAWPGLVVEENNLTVQIAAIRRTLAQVPGGDRWIETIPRRGYRFVGPVIALDRIVAPDAQPLGHVPLALTSFVGRERELIELKALLAKNRLLSLVGPGGIGKTRLAMQLAAEVRDAYPDGIWFADLVPLADPAWVANGVARALNAQQGSGNDEAVARHCKGRHLLLILDNCEHVLEASARLTDSVLRFAPEPTVLVTSREPLRTEGEQVYRLSSLSLPDPASTLDSMCRSEAVQLFVDRAQHRLPDFAMTTERAPAVAELCRSLDGIPLALELAAARLDSLSLEEINKRLHDRFRLLTGGLRTADPRHRTLRATLDWSYDLLSELQRTLLRRLGVFAGDFSPEAAFAVASDATIDEPGSTDALSQLVVRSLVLRNASPSAARYRLLETTHVYALEKLAASGETSATRRRHAEYFRGRFESASADWFRMSDADWYVTYLPELDNVRQALDWALHAEGDAAIGISLAAHSRSMWTALGLHQEGRRWLEVALSRVESQTSQADLARLRLSLGVLLEQLGPAESIVHLEQAIGLYRELGDTFALGFALTLIIRSLVNAGRVGECSRFLAEAAPLVQRSGLPKLLGFYYGASAWVKSATGDMAGARSDVERALELCKQCGAEYVAPATHLGDLAWAMEDLDAAASAFGEVVAMMRRSTISRKPALGYALANLAGVLAERGDLGAAMAAAHEGLPLLAEVGGFAWRFMDHFAWCAALARKFSNAARLVGFADSAHASRKTVRQPNERRARDRLEALLHAELTVDGFERLRAEGAKMSEDDACRLVLEDG